MHDQKLLHRGAAIFRGILNDLKRNERVAAEELGVDEAVIRAALDGSIPVPDSLIRKAAEVWPVNERDFLPIHDDAPTGAVVMRAAEAAATSRVLQRGNRDYYEYRDTAMSRVAPLRPEWIRILNPVQDNDAQNPSVEWNKGHFLYQFTYFIGEVNYYYEWEGVRHCTPMKTGDTVFGLPYAPHSFSTRSPAEPGLILALTFGGRFGGDTLEELSAMPTEAMERMTLSGDGTHSASAALLRGLIDARGYSEELLATKSGIRRERITALLNGSEAATPEELPALAGALRAPVRELLASEGDTVRGVRIVHDAEAPVWTLPDGNDPSYRMKELAGTASLPHVSGLEITALRGPDASEPTPLECGLHQYLYVIGKDPVVLSWSYGGKAYEETLQPDDSVYLKPHVPHKVRLAGEGPADGRILALRVGGRLVGDTAVEARILGPACLRRVVADADCWYNQETRH
jgi:transcriptional regulator with XRE-family HTH domain